MTIDASDLCNSILESLSRIENFNTQQIPDIPLYMDQLTHFMEERLAPTKRDKEDKILTKTMINNYTKNKLLPPPEKKKYTKDHLLTLIFIYYFKNVLSLDDIKHLLCPITAKYDTHSTPSLEEIYNSVFSLEGAEVERVAQTIEAEFEVSKEAVDKLENLDESEKDFLEKFTFICLLNFDVYIKKLLIEKIIDSMNQK